MILEGFLGNLRKTFETHAKTVQLSSIANWSGFCDNEVTLQPVSSIFSFLLFIFSKVVKDPWIFVVNGV